MGKLARNEQGGSGRWLGGTQKLEITPRIEEKLGWRLASRVSRVRRRPMEVWDPASKLAPIIHTSLIVLFLLLWHKTQG